jgi:hypothetical protein
MSTIASSVRTKHPRHTRSIQHDGLSVCPVIVTNQITNGSTSLPRLHPPSRRPHRASQSRKCPHPSPFPVALESRCGWTGTSIEALPDGKSPIVILTTLRRPMSSLLHVAAQQQAVDAPDGGGS